MAKAGAGFSVEFASMRLVLLVLTLCLLWVSPALAQTSATDKAAAEALFDEGVKLLGKGQYEAACKKLEDSERVDPGIGTLLYLADCYEKLGKTASAWATFRAAASMAQNAGQAERARAGMERADKLEGKLVRLSIDAAPETRALTGLTIKRGAEVVPLTLLGTEFPVDPGDYEIVASAPGYLPFSTKVTVGGAAASQTVAIPALEVDPNAPEPAAEEPVAEEPAAPAEQKQAEPPRGRTQRTVGLVLGGLGVVGLGVGSVFGVLAIDKNNQAKQAGCDGAGCPDANGVALTDAALDSAGLSTGFFIAGGALLATGAVVYFTAPHSQKETALVRSIRVAARPGGLSLQVGGTF